MMTGISIQRFLPAPKNWFDKAPRKSLRGDFGRTIQFEPSPDVIGRRPPAALTAILSVPPTSTLASPIPADQRARPLVRRSSSTSSPIFYGAGRNASLEAAPPRPFTIRLLLPNRTFCGSTATISQLVDTFQTHHAFGLIPRPIIA